MRHPLPPLPSLHTPLLCLGALLWLASCGGSEPVAHVRLSFPSTEVWAEKTLQLVAEPLDDGREPLQGREITWHSEDPEVASVDANGLVTGVTLGTTAIVATCEGKEARLNIKVRSRAQWLAVWSADDPTGPTPVVPSFPVGTTTRLRVEAYDLANASVPDATRATRWSTSDATIATVTADETGAVVTGLAPGLVTLTATFEGVRGEYPLFVGKGYTLTRFGTQPIFQLEVTNLNEHGHVVGHINERAFLWQGGTVIDLGLQESVAWDVNDAGQVVGSFFHETNIRHPFSWQAGQVTDLAPDATQHIHAVAINERGEVAGYTNALWTTGGEPARAVVWRDGQLTDLGRFDATGAYVLDISPQGHLVGFRTASSRNTPFILRDGQLTQLSVQSSWGAAGGTAVAISEDGAVVGNTGDGAFVWKDGVFSYIPPRFDTAMRVSDVNRHGQVVGQSEHLNISRAFVWKDGTAVDLTGLVREQERLTLINARAINDRGQIAVEVRTSGVLEGGLLTPVP